MQPTSKPFPKRVPPIPVVKRPYPGKLEESKSNNAPTIRKKTIERPVLPVVPPLVLSTTFEDPLLEETFRRIQRGIQGFQMQIVVPDNAELLLAAFARMRLGPQESEAPNNPVPIPQCQDDAPIKANLKETVLGPTSFKDTSLRFDNNAKTNPKENSQEEHKHDNNFKAKTKETPQVVPKYSIFEKPAPRKDDPDLIIKVDPYEELRQQRMSMFQKIDQRNGPCPTNREEIAPKRQLVAQPPKTTTKNLLSNLQSVKKPENKPNSDSTNNNKLVTTTGISLPKPCRTINTPQADKASKVQTPIPPPPPAKTRNLQTAIPPTKHTSCVKNKPESNTTNEKASKNQPPIPPAEKIKQVQTAIIANKSTACSTKDNQNREEAIDPKDLERLDTLVILSTFEFNDENLLDFTAEVEPIKKEVEPIKKEVPIKKKIPLKLQKQKLDPIRESYLE